MTTLELKSSLHFTVASSFPHTVHEGTVKALGC